MGYFIGHLVGDYLLQNNWMARNKKSPNATGLCACLVHSTIWSLSILFFAGWLNIQIFVLLVIQHFLVNRYHLIDWLMRVRDGKWDTKSGLYIALQIINDNVLHLACLFLMNKYVVQMFVG